MQNPSIKLPLIPEILRLICEQLHSNQGTLASLAATCTAFKDPALDTLWFTLYGFYILAQCLRPEVWKEVQGKHGKILLTIRKPIFPTDCVSMFQYAKRVKEFHFDDSYNKKVDMSIYEAIQVILNGQKLFPNVRFVSFSSSKDTDPLFSFINLFLGPYFTRITWIFPGTLSSQLSIIPMLEEHYPDLTEICFGFDDISDSRYEHYTTVFLSNRVYKWNKLQSLEISNITRDGLVNLSKLPHLRRLSLACWKPDTSFDSSSTREPIRGFSSLKILEIDTLSSSCTTFLETVECWSKLQKLGILMRDVASPEEWRNLFKAIHDRCVHEVLEDIDCTDDFTEGEPTSYDDIQPLLAFKNLRKLRIIASELSIPNAGVTLQMARSWPKIESLKLESAPLDRSDETPTITLLDLLPFAEHCPDLKTLSIRINATSPPPIEKSRPGNGISQTKLTSLDVGHSPASNHGAIAAFLSSTFPSLRKIYFLKLQYVVRRSRDGIELQTEDWGKAEELLGVFAAVREQERFSSGSGL